MTDLPPGRRDRIVDETKSILWTLGVILYCFGLPSLAGWGVYLALRGNR